MRLLCRISIHGDWRIYYTYSYKQYEFKYCGYCAHWFRGDSPLDTKKYPDLAHWYEGQSPNHSEGK